MRRSVTLIFGLVATVMGILLKAEYDKRSALQQQVSEHKRKAYAAFNDTINDFLTHAKEKEQTRNIERAAKQLMELRQGIWQYGSDEVVKAFALWNQCVFASNNDNDLAAAAIVLMADLIVKMRRDLGLSKVNTLSSLDILRVFINDVETKYDGLVASAINFRTKMRATKHVIL